ncbi:MAG: cobaltochelatase subunit CobN [Sarcina sp.]
MKKILGILFHYNFATLSKIKKDFEGIADLKLYSSKLLLEGKQSITELYKDIETCDVMLLNRTSSDQVWGEIEGAVDESKKEKIYVGDELIAYANKDKEQLEKSVKCNEYFTCNGRWNLINMIKFILNDSFDLDYEYEEAKELPWDGIFHPQYDGYFTELEEYLEFKPKGDKGTIGLLTSRSYWINEDTKIEEEFIKIIESKGYNVIPVYTYYNRDKEKGDVAHAQALKQFFFDKNGNPCVDAVVKLVSFGLIEPNYNYNNDGREKTLLQKLNCPIFKPIVSGNMTIEEWEKDLDGAVKDIQWGIALPEMEGNIEPVFVGAVEKDGEREQRTPIPERCQRVVNRAINYIKLRKKENKDKKVVFVVNNNPCASIEANVGSAANLDGLQSIVNMMNAMKDKGYTVENIPKDGKALAKEVLDRKAISEFRWTTVNEIVEKGGCLDLVTKDEYMKWFNKFSEKTKAKIINDWGNPPGEEKFGVPPSMIYEEKIVISGIQFGNVIFCVQPKRGCSGPGCDGKVCKILHDPAVAPTHQYIATYRWFEEKFGADVVIHMGTHGNLEFLPGKAVGLSKDCYPDICIGNLPYINVYNSDNPPEGTIAKRRALATIVDHMQTVITDGEAYGPLADLENLINQYEMMKYKQNGQEHILEHLIAEAIVKAKLDKKINLDNVHTQIDRIVKTCSRIVSLITTTALEDGKHIIGEIPQGERMLDMLNSIVRFESDESVSLRGMIAGLLGMDFDYLLENMSEFNFEFEKLNSAVLQDLDKLSKKVIAILLVRGSLSENREIFEPFKIVNEFKFTEIEVVFMERLIDIKNRIEGSDELNAVLRAMDGEFISPGPAGVINRGKDDILPTGRNFYTLDPTTLPTKAAYEIGKRLAGRVIEKHIEEEGKYPENFAMYLMANDFMWSDGEGMAQLMNLIGVRPVWGNGGSVKGFEIISLEDLQRPRIDVTIKISGIVRDAFLCRIELLDEAIKAVAALDEPLDMNYVRKHTLDNLEDAKEASLEDIDNASSRIFGTKAGTYFSAVTGMIYASAWKEKDDIADVFMYYNSYKYGKGQYGEQSLKDFKNTLSTVDITYNKIVANAHDLLGCCTYFSTHGGMTAAAKKVSKNTVKAYYGDTRETKAVEVRDLSEEIDRVVKGKLLNPKWIDGQKRHGYTGASEISELVGRVYGWDATTDEVDDRLFDGITETFVLDEDNRKFFEENNPYALEEIERRLIEAYERNLWETDDEMIEKLKDSYLETEGWIEEGMVENSGSYQGGAIDIVDLKEVEFIKGNMKEIKNLFK